MDGLPTLALIPGFPSPSSLCFLIGKMGTKMHKSQGNYEDQMSLYIPKLFVNSKETQTVNNNYDSIRTHSILPPPFQSGLFQAGNRYAVNA